MKYFYSRFRTAIRLLDQYTYPEPFHIAIKAFFKHQKKYGSKDRKAISEICYTYLRCGRLFQNVDLEKGVLLSALFIETMDVASWNTVSAELGYDLILPEGFFEKELSLTFILASIDGTLDFYNDPYLMDEFSHYNGARNIRFRPKNWSKDHTDDVSRQLGIVGVRELTLNQKLDDTIQVQDLSSQYVCSQIDCKEGQHIWDVCSGAGGKSLNLMAAGSGNFYLSDTRPGIIQNAKSRVKSMLYRAHFGVADMEEAHETITFGAQTVDHQYFDIIVVDVPCTGSGTWFRNPEHFSRFDYTTVKSYANRQKSIVKNALPFLKKGGKLFYITCSIFTEENRDVTEWILENFPVKIVDEICFDGIKQRADGMYMAGFEMV